MRRSRGLAVFALLLLTGCRACTGEARINCEPDLAAKVFRCSMQHVSGGAVKKCWSIKTTCENMASVAAYACERVEPGKTMMHDVPFPRGRAECRVRSEQIDTQRLS